MSTIELGRPVPNFTLPASNGEKVSLSQFKGKKVVLFFYPKNMTPGCTTESCDFRDFNGEFLKQNTEVIGISPDNLKSHDKFIAKHDLPFLLLSDKEHQVSDMFGIWKKKKMFGKEFYGVIRSTYLIDEQGKLMAAWPKVKVDGHVEEVLEKVKEADRG